MRTTTKAKIDWIAGQLWGAMEEAEKHNVPDAYLQLFLAVILRRISEDLERRTVIRDNQLGVTVANKMPGIS